MDFLIGGVSSLLSAMSSVLRGWSFTRNLGNDIAELTPYWQKANAIIPVDAALVVLGIYVAVNMALIAYYWITRVINLLRGAG